MADVRARLEMSLDDLIKAKPHKQSGAGVVNKASKPRGRVPIAIGQGKTARAAKATGIGAKKLAFKAKRAAGTALAGIRSAPKQQRNGAVMKQRGVTKVISKTGVSIRGKNVAKSAMAQRIISRARANKQGGGGVVATGQLQLSKKQRMAGGAVKANGAAGKSAPKFVAGGQGQGQKAKQGQAKRNTAAQRIGQQRQQQQQQQVGGRGRGRVPNQLQGAGGKLNRTQGGGVRKQQHQAQTQRQQQGGVRRQMAAQRGNSGAAKTPYYHQGQQQAMYTDPQQYALAMQAYQAYYQRWQAMAMASGGFGGNKRRGGEGRGGGFGGGTQRGGGRGGRKGGRF